MIPADLDEEGSTYESWVLKNVLEGPSNRMVRSKHIDWEHIRNAPKPKGNKYVVLPSGDVIDESSMKIGGSIQGSSSSTRIGRFG